MAFERVLKEHPNATFTIIGDGPQRQILEDLADQLKINHAVRFEGAMEQKDAQKLIMRHWVFCQHSIPDLVGSQEGFGLTLAESSAAGMPIISTFHGGIPEHIIHEKNGILVPEYDIDAMANAMMRLLIDSELRQKLGNEGVRLYKNRFTCERRLSQIKSILNA